MRRTRHPLAILALLLTAACATEAPLPQETLDERTGTTVSQLLAPLRLIASEPGAPAGDPFAFAAPFETNRMGQRQLYLWVAVPGEDGAASVPVIQPDAADLALGEATGDAAALGLNAFPYAAPAPWSRIFVFHLDEAALRRLETATHLTIAVQYAKAGRMQFAGAWDGAGAIAAFRKQLGLAAP